MKIAVFAIVALAGTVASAKVLDTSTSALSAGFGERAQGAWTTSFETTDLEICTSESCGN
jgi:hypothetical protein